MADENPPTPPAGDITATPKKETVRITLPAKAMDAPTIKRETVRINAPPAAAPKRETTQLPGLGDAVSTPPPPASKPFIPPPPGPKPTPPAGPLPGIKPLSAPSAPKPPMAPRPTVPLKPATPGALPVRPAAAPVAQAPAPEAAKPVVMKPAAPKKETARIQVAPEAKSMMPKATIRMQQTQPLSAAPAPALKAASLAVSGNAIEDEDDDPVVGVMSWIMLVASIAAAALSYLSFSA